MEIIKNILQGSHEWHELRLGIITASRFKDVMSNGRGNAPSKTRASYMLQLAAEMLTGLPTESYSNEYMEWGTKTEPQARATYELETGNDVDEVAFIKCDIVGISPDGLIGDKGGIEIKCPKTTTQIETFLKGEVPSVHKAQIQGSLWASEREWWDFVSFDPRIDGEASFFLKRVERDEEYIDKLKLACDLFHSDLTAMVKQLRG
jgi:putative phage-type endonuclease